MPHLLRPLLASLLALPCMLHALPAAAHDFPSAELAAQRGWQRVQHPGWEVPLYFPLPIGTIESQPASSTLDWLAGEEAASLGYPVRVSVRLENYQSGGLPPAAGPALVDWLRGQLADHARAGEIEIEDGLFFGGRAWLRAAYLDAEGSPDSGRYTLYSLPQASGLLSVRCTHGPLTEELMVDGLMADVLDGPVSALSAFPAYAAPPAPVPVEPEAAPALDGLGLAWALSGGAFELPQSQASGAEPQSNRRRMIAVEGYAGVLFFPGHGTLRVAGKHGATREQLKADISWKNPSAPAGEIYAIDVAVADGAANPLAGNREEQVARVERALAKPGRRVTRLPDLHYDGESWLFYSIFEEGRPPLHRYTLYGTSGLDAVLIDLYVDEPVDTAARDAFFAMLLAGYGGVEAWVLETEQSTAQ